jgi:osmotically-inducible protein OsmY
MMNIASKKRLLAMCAYLAPVVAGLAGLATPAGAQNPAASAVRPSESMAAPARQGAHSTTDEELRARVQAALHSDPYFYDEHIRVSVENGVVALRGFVFSDWDVQDAMRIASRAAPRRRVTDDLTIQTGGRR